MNENEIEVETPETPEAPETSLRDDIEASLAELSGPAETPEPAAEPEPSDSPVEETEAQRVERERDEKGRFKAKAASPAGAAEPAAPVKPAEVAPAASAGAPVPEPAPAEVPERAPQSWKPLAREHWAKLPSEVRQEVARREQDHNRLLQETAQARKGYSEFQEVIRPFEAMIRAEAGDPIRGIQGLLGTAYNLRTGAPQQKAQIIAGLIQGYGVSVEDLANVLEGQPVAAQAPRGPVQDPRVDQLWQKLEQAEQSRQQMVTEQARSQLEDARARLEFFDDLRPDIADVLEIATKRGQKMTVDQAYAKALALSEDHQKILRQREQAKRVTAASAQSQRARTAASSVRSSPAVTPPRSRAGTSLREDIEDAMRELQGR